MRALVGTVLLLLLIALATLQWSGLFGDDGTPLSPGDAPPSVAPSEGTHGAATAAPPAVATRTLPRETPAPSDLADAPTACLLVVDHATSRPVAGAPLRRVQNGAEIAFTDERGLAAVALREPEQLTVVVDAYLLRLVPTRLGTSEVEPQEVRLVRDDWSFVRRFHFAAPGGNPVTEAFVRFRPTPPARGVKPPPSPGPTGDPVLQRAWTEHTMLAGRPACADVPVQLGTWSEDRVHRLPERAEVRFAAAGDFLVEVATANGLVGRAELRIDPRQRVDATTIRIALVPGAVAAGTVVDAAGAPVANASIELQGGEPLGLVATSAADGAFRIGPLLPGNTTLHVKHGDHEPLAFGPVAVPAETLRVVLQPLPRTSLRGRVRARPSLLPIANATVSWTAPGGSPVVATTAADGTFSLRATGEIDARLAVQALGHLAYAELVAPGAPFADYDLWPATTETRVSQGLTAVLEGVVLDAVGAPLAATQVRFQPAQRTDAPAALPGRRVLEGGALVLPLATTTAADGSFRIETHVFGPGRVTAGGSAVDAVVVAGQTTSDLRLRP